MRVGGRARGVARGGRSLRAGWGTGEVLDRGRGRKESASAARRLGLRREGGGGGGGSGVSVGGARGDASRRFLFPLNDDAVRVRPRGRSRCELEDGDRGRTLAETTGLMPRTSALASLSTSNPGTGSPEAEGLSAIAEATGRNGDEPLDAISRVERVPRGHHGVGRPRPRERPARGTARVARRLRGRAKMDGDPRGAVPLEGPRSSSEKTRRTGARGFSRAGVSRPTEW